MLLTKFIPHCNIFITHDFYEDGWSRDFDIQADVATRKNWRAMEYRPRLTDQGLSIYYPTNGLTTDAQREISRSTKWQMALHPKDSNFLFYTDLDFSLSLPLGAPFLYLSNFDPLTGTLDANVDSSQNALLTKQAVATNDDVIGLVSPAFTAPYDPVQHNRIEIWRLWPGQAAEQVQEITNLSTSSSEKRISLPTSTQGLHEVRWLGNSSRQALIYVDSELAKTSTLGVIEIYRNPPVDYSQTINYYLEFVRRTALWRYYVVNNQASITGTDLLINASVAGTGAYPAVVQFDQIPTINQTDEEKRTALAISEQEVILFRSQAPLPYFEVPLGGLELRVTEGLNQRTLFANLPNPSAQQAKPNLFIQL